MRTFVPSSVALALASGACAFGVQPASVSMAPSVTPAVVAQSGDAEASTMGTSARSPGYVASDQRWLDETEGGFLNGLRGFEHLYNPVGNPLYHETPQNQTSAKALFLYHGFPDDSQLQGGEVIVAALQIRVALTERLGFIATKDGYSWFNSGIGIDEDGWNDAAAGLKYTFYADKDADLLIAGGARFMLPMTGEAKVLQGRVGEVSPFVSILKGYDRWQFGGNATYRLPLDSDDGNDVIQWDITAGYEVTPGIMPMIELHGLHYVSDGEAIALNVGGLDYSNLGSSNVEGSTVVWIGVGGRIKFNPHLSLGATFEYPLTNRDADIMGERITADLEFTF